MPIVARPPRVPSTAFHTNLPAAMASPVYLDHCLASRLDLYAVTTPLFAQYFVAMECEFGAWSAFRYYGIMADAEYAAMSGKTPSDAFRQMQEIRKHVKVWEAMGYPFLSRVAEGRAYERIRAFGRHLGRVRWEVNQRTLAIQCAEQEVLQQWKRDRNRDDGEQDVAKTKRYIHLGAVVRGRRKCICPDRHTGRNACIVCAFPAPIAAYQGRFERIGTGTVRSVYRRRPPKGGGVGAQDAVRDQQGQDRGEGSEPQP